VLPSKAGPALHYREKASDAGLGHSWSCQASKEVEDSRQEGTLARYEIGEQLQAVAVCFDSCEVGGARTGHSGHPGCALTPPTAWNASPSCPGQ
jgi:hypothetical protein